MSYKILPSIVATSLALLSSCAFAQNDDLAGRISALEQKVQQQSNTSMADLSKVADNGGFFMTDTKNPFDQMHSITLVDDILNSADDFKNAQLILGGSLQLDAQKYDVNDLAEGSSNGKSFYTTNADFNTLVNLSDNSSIFVNLAAAPSSNTASDHAPAVKKAFFTYGNLKQSPIYASIGLEHIPFGQFGGGGPYTDSLIKTALRPSAQNVAMMGFDQDGLNTYFGFYTTNTKNNFSYSMHYQGTVHGLSYGMGAGYLHDVRNIGGALGGAYASALKDNGRNALMEANANIGTDLVSLSGEYVRARKDSIKTDGTNLSKASAYQVTLDYNPVLFGTDATSFMLGYGKTMHMNGIAMDLPMDPASSPSSSNGLKTQYLAAVTQEVYSNTFASFEYGSLESYNDKKGTTYTLDLSMYF